MTMRRHAMAAVALAFTLNAPRGLLAQPRAQTPNPDTPRLLVAVFWNNHGPSGVQTADAIRTRIANVTSVKQLYAVPKNIIVEYLKASGYEPDSALPLNDLRELAKGIRADEILAGRVTRTATGLRIEARFMLPRDVGIAQPLPVIETTNLGEAAREIERALKEARTQLADNRTCENHVRAREFEKAIDAARGGIAKYPNATIARLCLATAFNQKAAPDSALKALDEVRGIDPRNTFALALAYDIHKARGDQEGAVRAIMALFALDPTNLDIRRRAILEIVQLGKVDVAIGLVDTLLQQNPGDWELTKQKWQLQLRGAASDTVNRVQRFASAIATGEAMVRLDTALADSTYFDRQIAAASADTTQPQRAVDFASRAANKYPFSVHFLQVRAQSERKAGQRQQARESMMRALAINPRLPNANLFLAQLAVDMEQPDTAVAIAQTAIAAGEDPKVWAAFLLTPTQWAFRKAQETHLTEDFRRALAFAQESEKLAPSQHAKFFIGVSSFSLGIEALRAVSSDSLRAPRLERCGLARTAQEMMLLTQINMVAGAPIEPNTASTVLRHVATYAPAADQMVRQLCSSRR